MMNARTFERAVAKLTARLQRRVMLMVGRCLLIAIDDSKKAQSVQAALLADEVREDVERFQEYGFTSVPDKNCEAVVVFVGGNRAHGIVVATEDRRYRITDLETGEVALYTKDDGKRVYLKSDGEVHLGTDPSEFVALSNLVKDELDNFKTDLDNLKTILVSHVHPGCMPGPSSVAPSPAFASYTPHTPGEVAAEEVKAK